MSGSYKRTPEIRIKMKQAAIHRFSDPNERLKCSRSGKNHAGFGKKRPDHSEKMKLWWTNFKQTSEYQELRKLRSELGKVRSKRTGWHHTEEHKKLMKIKMTGRIFSNETIEKMRKSAIGKHDGEKNGQFGKPPVYPIPKFVEELGHEVRSSLEKNTFILFKKYGIKYKYETQGFLVDNCVVKNYWPDALILENIYVECKGNFAGISGSQSIQKCIQFRKQYPGLFLWIVTYREWLDRIPMACYDRLLFIEDLEEELKTLELKKMETAND